MERLAPPHEIYTKLLVSELYIYVLYIYHFMYMENFYISICWPSPHTSILKAVCDVQYVLLCL